MDLAQKAMAEREQLLKEAKASVEKMQQEQAAAPKKEEEKPSKLVIQAPEPPARISRIVKDEVPEIKVAAEEVKIAK